jgi:hypothetical protein
MIDKHTAMEIKFVDARDEREDDHTSKIEKLR